MDEVDFDNWRCYSIQLRRGLKLQSSFEVKDHQDIFNHFVVVLGLHPQLFVFNPFGIVFNIHRSKPKPDFT